MQEETTTTCPICIELISLHALELCGHSACMTCFKRWFEACERTGQPMPTCPACRNPVNHADVHLMLGRPFAPSGSHKLNADDGIDELTQQWLSAEAKQCRACGSWVVKSEGCDKMQCLCGYRFCFHCGAQGAICTCTPRNHIFWDNILRQDARYAESLVATPEELQDMRSFMAASAARARELTRKAHLEALKISLERRYQQDKLLAVAFLKRGEVKRASYYYLRVIKRPEASPSIESPWTEELKTLLDSMQDVDTKELFPGLEGISSLNDTKKPQTQNEDGQS